ncbi:hypothetical protein ACJX0J_042050, partial [Zea mays]
HATEATKKLLHNTTNSGGKCQIEDTKMQDLVIGSFFQHLYFKLSLVRNNKTKESFQDHEIRGQKKIEFSHNTTNSGDKCQKEDVTKMQDLFNFGVYKIMTHKINRLKTHTQLS